MSEPGYRGAERQRLDEAAERTNHWKRWGPYVSDRAWGTVREDYSQHGTAWEYLPHDHARSKAYVWGEDGIAGICDNHQRLCLSLAMWNGRDAILKERLFGLTGNEGNHSEDVKEQYHYLDCTPTHSYMKFLYLYPHSAFPYEELVQVNGDRGRREPEYELLDTGVFDQSRYFEITVEYAKADVEDICMRVTAVNRGPEPAVLHLLPTLWFRNTWARDGAPRDAAQKPKLQETVPLPGTQAISVDHKTLGRRLLFVDVDVAGAIGPRLLFTDNETNRRRLGGDDGATRDGASPYSKDGIERYLIAGDENAVNHGQVGTKAAAVYEREVGPGEEFSIHARLLDGVPEDDPLHHQTIDRLFGERLAEADEFYADLVGSCESEDARNVQRQALAGLLWSKQFYHYNVGRWLREGEDGDPPERSNPRNADWTHLHNEDIISMPDKWEYPWYASWDLAFHCIPLALVDVDFAKDQLILFLREWYMHPNGQIPAYEWAFDDVNPPVHAWAVWRVYKIEKRVRGRADTAFLERAFHKLLLNFTWWVNRKDDAGNNIFEGGFLGLDNIGVFDRSSPLPTGGTIEQSDGTSWMGMFCLNMLAIALELAKQNRAYSDIASKFFEHFVYISHAINHLGDENLQLWDEEDGFFYDALCLPDGSHKLLKVRSMVGLITLFAVETLDPELVDSLPGFKRRMMWFIKNRPHLRDHIAFRERQGHPERRLLAIVGRDRLRRVLKRMLDEKEFLSPYGIRALSRHHQDQPYVFPVDGHDYRVDYEPAESATGMFGGNSNWRGPIWFPVNYLIIESLQKFHYYYGEEYKVECPTGSGQMMSLWEVSSELSKRLSRIFLKDENGRRPVFGDCELPQRDPHWQDALLFYEYFHGDTGAGLGASHQTGWTALVAKLLQQSGGGL